MRRLRTETFSQISVSLAEIFFSISIETLYHKMARVIFTFLRKKKLVINYTPHPRKFLPTKVSAYSRIEIERSARDLITSLRAMRSFIFYASSLNPFQRCAIISMYAIR